jgi:hypothetical protein
MTTYDRMPIEARRANWGWFGPPWPSGICYDEEDGGRLTEEMRKPFPAGESCLYCETPFDEAAGDNGQAMPRATAGGVVEIRHIHKECGLRSVLGPVAHLEGRCSCHGGDEHDAPGRTVREEALTVWAWVQAHGTAAGAG